MLIAQGRDFLRPHGGRFCWFEPLLAPECRLGIKVTGLRRRKEVMDAAAQTRI